MSELLQLVLIWSIPVAPLIACVGITFAGRERWKPHSHKLAVAALAVALLASRTVYVMRSAPLKAGAGV